MSAGIARRVAGGIGEQHDRKFQPLGLVDGHDPHTLSALFDDRRLLGLAALGVVFQLLDEGAKG